MLKNINPNKPIVQIEDLGYLYPKKTSKQKSRYALYRCYCGNTFKAHIQSVKSGHTTSCGCFKKQVLNKVRISHNCANHILFDTWTNIIQRCNNKNNPRYKDYGERGIKVCDRWLDVKNFIDDMYPTYEQGLTVERINNDGNYEPSNCRWATLKEQSINKRLYKNNKTGFRGVSLNATNKKYSSYITINKKRIHLGYFNTAIDAAKAYNNYVCINNLTYNLNAINGGL